MNLLLTMVVFSNKLIYVTTTKGIWVIKTKCEKYENDRNSITRVVIKNKNYFTVYKKISDIVPNKITSSNFVLSNGTIHKINSDGIIKLISNIHITVDNIYDFGSIFLCVVSGFNMYIYYAHSNKI
jgi:hypothetical protein